MRVLQTLTLAAFATQSITAASLPGDRNALSKFDKLASRAAPILSPDHSLERRKGGGRGGGSSSGSSSGGSRSSSSSSGRTGTGSSQGGATRAGSGPSRSYGGGGYYGGGAAVPYQSGQRNAKGLLAAPLIGVLAIAAFFPGLWYWNVYPYHFSNPYRFVNESLRNSSFPNGVNMSLPVVCLCQEFSVCGCEDNSNQQYLKDIIGNGSYATLNKTLVNVAMNGSTQTLYINGTLPNGTTAPGGTEAAASTVSLGKYTGYWLMSLIVLYGVLL